ncbi:MAG: hypothetical protein KDE19_20715 [Caldilineaceae bacterium]|nr:hypothetical protein [Caldilineaceae bacterium]
MNTYTFHVSLPGHGRVWRKVELPTEATLEDLHLTIQNAYEFDNDHLYSFFMSGKAWDSSTEYSLPEDVMPFGVVGVVDEDGNVIDDIDADELEDEDELDEDEDEMTQEDSALMQTLLDLPEPPAPAAGEEIEMPTTDQARAMFTELQNNPELREQFMQGMAAQLGLPPAMAQMIVGNLENVFNNISDQELESIINMGPNMLGGGMPSGAMGGFLGGNEATGDVRTTTLESLNLQKGKKFLYLFDYGDEWRFNVKVDAINKDADPNLTYPRIVESVGEAPEQYPDWGDDEWDEEDWDDEA